MPLPSFLQRFFQGASGQRQRPGAEAVSLSQADVEAIRVRARRRLVGMAVLVGAGVIGFPWLFETKPRPMAMDIAVVQQGASAPAAGSDKPGVRAQVKSVSKPQLVREPHEEIIDEPPKVAQAKSTNKGDDRKGDKNDAKGDKKSDNKADAKADVRSDTKSTDKDKKPTDTKAAAAADKPASDAPVRYVVQIGAYGDVPTAHEVRMKAERVGLKTYTQVVGADANKKIRVRLGPFEDKAAADKAMANLRKAGLTGALLTL